MANRYWVGGSGTWDATSTANWSETSGGVGGASAPTSLDDVYFDSNSSSAPFTVTIDSVFEGSGTVTSGYVLNVSAVIKGTVGIGNTVYINTSVNTGINSTGASLFVNITSTGTGTGGIGTYNTNAIASHGNLSKIFVGYASARSVNFSTSQAITLAGIAPLVCNGSFTNIATNFTNNWQGDIVFTGSGTHSINTGGWYLTKRAVIVNAPLGSYTLASAFASGGASDGFSLAIGFYLFGGTFDTAGYSMYVGRLVARPTYNASLFLRNSEINLYYGWQIILFTNSGGFLTLDSGTSKISVLNGGNASLILGNNNSFYTIELLPYLYTTPLYISGNNASINTFLIKRNTVSLEENLSIGQLTILGDSNFPAKIYTNAPQKTLSANSVNLSNVIFSGIIASGPAIPWSGLNIGDANNNTNITFSSPRTLYWNLAGSQNWNSNGWSLTSGGAPSSNNFPLPQDTCIFDNSGAAGTITLNVNDCDIGSIDFSQRTTAVTVTSGSNNISFYKNVTLSSAVTITGTGTWNFLGTTIQEIISSGRTIAPAINVNGAGIKLVDAFSNSGNFTLTQGSLDINEKTLTCGGAIFSLVSNGTLTRSINFGTNGFIYLTRQAASFGSGNISNFTATDTGGGLVFMNGGVHQVFGSNQSTDRSMAINVRVAPSSRSFNFEWQPSIVKNVTFDQGYTGAVNFRGCRVLGNLVFSPNMSVFENDSYNGILFQGETQTLKTNGVVVGCPIWIGFGWLGGIVSGILPNLTLLDNLSVIKSVDTFQVPLFSLERGTLNLNGKKLTISANSFKPGFESNVTTTRNLIFGGGSIEVQGNISPWTVNATNLSVQGPGTINLTSASAKTFAGGGANYSGVTLVHGGAGNLTISGNNTFSSIRNTISQTAGSSIIFTSGSTTTITGKTGLSGTISAPLYLASSSTGTYTINNSGTSIQQADYLSVNNSIVTPANNWFAGTRSTVTNSTGWSNTFSSAADLFWVGGNGTWDSSTNTNWAVVSGGTGGTIAPTSTNNITFDSNSDAGSAFTVTVGTGAVCNTFNANSENSLDQAMTLAGTASCSINESLFLPPINFTRTYTGTVNFVGTLSKLINTNGVSFDNNFNFDGVATYNLQSSLTNSSSKDIYFNAGIINTNNFNVSSGRFFLTSTNLQQVNLESSTITISGGVLTGWQVESSATNLVLNSGTSLLRFSYLYGSLLDNRTSGSNKVYYNVEFINSDHNIISDIACNNLTMASAADFIRLRGNLTVNGTLTVLARSSKRCVNFYSDALGSTVTANAVNFSRVFFKDITAAGASAPWIGQLGDMGNNNNIQFPAPKTVYWRSTIGDRVYSNSWGFTPTGAIDVNAIPLPQDTGVILDNFPSSGQGIILGWRDMNCGLDFSQRTQSVILNTIFISSSLMGDLILSPSVSFGSNLQSHSLEFYPNLRDIQFNPAGQTITFPISIRSGMNFESTTARTPSINYGFNISGPLNSTKSISVLAGTLNSNNFELSCTNFDSSGSLTRAINLGTSKVNVSGNWNLATSTNLAFTGSGTINMSGTSAKTFAGGSANYSGVILNQGGSGELTVTGNNQFGGISNTVRPASIKFAAGSTTTLGKFMLNGSDGAPVAISSTTTGTRYTLTSSAGVFAPYYTSIRDSNATGGAVWRAPINYGNVNVSNNLGWDFSNINIMTDNFMVLFPSNLHLTS